MYGECEGSQDKKIVMVSIGKGPRERRCGTKGRNEEKSATQEENRNITPVVQLRPRLNMHSPLLEQRDDSVVKPVLL